MFRPLVALSLLSAIALGAQTPHAPPPSIATYGQAQVKVSPDRATIRISVQTQDKTATTAASENATKQTAVLNALRALGIPNAQLSTSDYNVSPEYRYPQNQSPVLTGYTVTNTIVAELHDINQVGKAIDAALSHGANVISSLDFYASNTDSARHQAISTAVAQARVEAEIAARAAGGNLGPLMELEVNSQNPVTPPRPMYAKMAVGAADATPINPEAQTLTVTVNTRWTYMQR